MSLKYTKHTKYWQPIPKKCKICKKAFYTIEDEEVLYSCSIYGSFNKDCELKTPQKQLPKPKDILGE